MYKKSGVIATQAAIHATRNGQPKIRVCEWFANGTATVSITTGMAATAARNQPVEGRITGY